ncbi:hypothetical protein EZV62_005258 [Acer yangbiense]|uniref:Retrovirus-related Pol polyprotein from transposon TNT 1-94-like beta-barrel domain-containing protein n=1 Tax=Acer yangbiense TaxID=1000413 RepID=A0A5C7ILZ0_9ROSI|nr:hypothetical protein EZV62_005258 [Acer yangbiense]
MSADMATGSNASLHDKQVPALRANTTIAQIKQYEEEKMKRDKAVTCLHSALTDSVFTSIMHLETAKSIWDELKSRFEGSEKVKLVKLLTIKREFKNLKTKDSETVKDYSSKLSDLENQMRLYGDVAEDYKVVEKMLINLPKKFEAKVAAIEESCDLKTMTISEMVSKLQAQEQRHALRNDGDMEKTFLAMNKGKHKGKMDAASMFTTLDRNATTTVKLGNGDMVKAAGKGKVLIQTKSGPKIIDNALYILDLAQNLLSVAQLLKRGYSLIFEGNLCIILDSKKSEIVRVMMHENSFHVDFNQVKLNASMSKNDMVRDMEAKSGTDDLCDACLMSKHDMVKDVQATTRTYGLCDACQNGKAPMKPKIDGVFDGHSSNESVMDDGAMAKSDSLFLKTRSSADVYQKCKMMVNKPACNEEAAQMDEKKLAMKEELMMIKRNQALSSTKAEYIAAAAAPKQAKWIKKVSTNLNCVEKKPTGLWCNNSAFSMVKNPVHHGRSKHNNVKFYAIREAEKNGEVS